MAVGKIWWREAVSAWYCKVDGKQVRLAVEQERATELRNALLVEHGTRNPTVADVVTLYLDWFKTDHAEGTYNERVRNLGLLAAQFGKKDANHLQPSDLTRWLQIHYPTVGDTRKNDLLTMAQAAWNWAERNHNIRSRIKKLDKPTRKMREFYLPRSRWDELLEKSGAARDLIKFMLFTGARPQEARAIEKRHWNGSNQCFELNPSESKGRKRGRAIFVPDDILDTVIANVDNTDCYVFRNSDLQPWTKSALNCAARRIKTRINEPEFCMYSCRHSFAVDRIRCGVEISMVAELMGHSSTDMVFQRYGHLSKQIKRLIDAVNA